MGDRRLVERRAVVLACAIVPPVVFPPPPFQAALLRRAAGLWLLLRAAVVVVGMLAGAGPIHDLIFLAPPAAGSVALLAAWLTMFDARLRGEALFLADLGVPPGVLVLVALAPPVVGEMLVGAVGSQ
jgi:hypothetical protein